jgi:hypothetical protein
MASPSRKARRHRADKSPLEPEGFPARPRSLPLRFRRTLDCEDEDDFNSAKSIGASVARRNPRGARLFRDQKLRHE